MARLKVHARSHEGEGPYVRLITVEEGPKVTRLPTTTCGWSTKRKRHPNGGPAHD